MANFKKSISINGTFKSIAISDGNFFDMETGEIINVAEIIESAIGSNQEFDLKVSTKNDTDITPSDGE